MKFRFRWWKKRVDVPRFVCGVAMTHDVTQPSGAKTFHAFVPENVPAGAMLVVMTGGHFAQADFYTGVIGAA